MFDFNLFICMNKLKLIKNQFMNLIMIKIFISDFFLEDSQECGESWFS